MLPSIVPEATRPEYPEPTQKNRTTLVYPELPGAWVRRIREARRLSLAMTEEALSMWVGHSCPTKAEPATNPKAEEECRTRMSGLTIKTCRTRMSDPHRQKCRTGMSDPQGY